ncbi:hypothetical protein Tco_0671717 [Tanacetum coccineum]
MCRDSYFSQKHHEKKIIPNTGRSIEATTPAVPIKRKNDAKEEPGIPYERPENETQRNFSGNGWELASLLNFLKGDIVVSMRHDRRDGRKSLKSDVFDSKSQQLLLSIYEKLNEGLRRVGSELMEFKIKDLMGAEWICQILQEISQKRTRERMSDQEAKEIKAEAREIMPQPSTVNCS